MLYGTNLILTPKPSINHTYLFVCHTYPISLRYTLVLSGPQVNVFTTLLPIVLRPHTHHFYLVVYRWLACIALP